jgi:hypothetical protein
MVYQFTFFSEKLNINLSICKKISKNKFKLCLKKYLQKSFLETWLDIRNSYLLDTGKLSTYFKFKFTFNYESYLNMNNFNNRRILTRFRLSNHSLRIETGRHERKLNTVSGKLELLPRCERLCQHCSHCLIENELHFVLECLLYNSPRFEFLENLFQKVSKPEKH